MIMHYSVFWNTVIPFFWLIGILLITQGSEARLRGGYSSISRSSNANFRRRYSQGYSSDACVDRYARCPAWMRSGDCTANSVFMFVNCRKSCGLCTQQAATAIFAQEKRLKSTLLSGYDPLSRPIENFTDSIDVSLSFSLLHLLSVDEIKQSFTVQGHLKLKWRDSRLTWDPSLFSEIPLVSMPASKIWHPGITVVNTAIASEQFLLPGNPTPVMIRNTGTIVWTPRVEITALCNMDVKDFPADVHNCSVIFGPWLQDSASVNISIWDLDDDGEDYNGLLTAMSLPNQNWGLLSADLKFEEDYFNPCCSEPWPVIHAEFVFQRHIPAVRVTVFTVLIYVMITLLAPFLLPIRSLLRFVFASGDCGILLFFLLHLSRLIPNSSSTIPLIVQLTIALIMENILILLICVILYHLSSPLKSKMSLRLPAHSIKWNFLKVLIARIPKKVPLSRKNSTYNRLKEPRQDLVDMLLAQPGDDIEEDQESGECRDKFAENAHDSGNINGIINIAETDGNRSESVTSNSKEKVECNVDVVKVFNRLAFVIFALMFTIQTCVLFAL
ncbi:acetylcholine receptor subunit alpha-1-A-like [Paramacrobiotus metropolitanus]|uniref:acetylcholine receptor subunit alpha-1-A-like n=1 Tax=Paramacrobiotus metropolitanus TaxID=2943436 RepID=UPI002445754C|nr:acetylcholine receptor subunit alpha-1-A-like [Paramacrobiotus metropolitanus]